MKDNRNYKYTNDSDNYRGEYKIILKHLKRGSKIIDLGSAEGSLLKLLKDKKRTRGIGIEISSSGVKSSLKKGIKSICGRIDVELPFKDNEFDYAICNVTLNMVAYPEVLIKEMTRISKKQIITFTNFGYIMNRLELLFKGRMPEFMLGGYKWFSTGLAHQLSLSDFIDFCETNSIQIIETDHIFPNRLFVLPETLLRFFPNLFAGEAVFITSKKKKMVYNTASRK